VRWTKLQAFPFGCPQASVKTFPAQLFGVFLSKEAPGRPLHAKIRSDRLKLIVLCGKIELIKKRRERS
jgi:hypothetical protein